MIAEIVVQKEHKVLVVASQARNEITFNKIVENCKKYDIPIPSRRRITMDGTKAYAKKNPPEAKKARANKLGAVSFAYENILNQIIIFVIEMF